MTTRLAGLFMLCLSGAGFSVLGAAGAAAADRVAWIDDLGLRSSAPVVWLPAPAGAIVGIDEQRKTDSYTQTITLQGDRETVGENRIVVTVTRNGLAPRIEQDGLDTEMAESLPDVSIAIGPAGSRNAIGIVGTAVGSKGPLNCLYGWQRVNLADRLITGEDAGPFAEHHALSIRYRLCRTTLSAAQLVALVENAQAGGEGDRISATAPMGLDALTTAASLDGGRSNAVGLLAAPPSALAPAGFGSVAMGRPDRRRRVMQHRRRVAAQTPAGADAPKPPAMVPMAGMPSVPLPQ